MLLSIRTNQSTVAKYFFLVVIFINYPGCTTSLSLTELVPASVNRF